MLSLTELQAAFARDLMQRGTPAVAELVEGDATSRLAIYRNNVFSNYRNALREVYPVVLRLVGEDFFRQTADAYVRACPSQSGDLSDFGNRFAGFLMRYAPASELPYLPDVARLEWAVECALYAADAAPLAVDELAQFAPERLTEARLELQPAARLIASEYPIARIWQVNQPDFAGEDSVNLAEGEDRVLVRRREFTVEVVRLTADEYVWLSALERGAALGEAYAEAARASAHFDLAACMQRHVSGGTFAAAVPLKPPPPTPARTPG